jgi:hypothetical protein
MSPGQLLSELAAAGLNLMPVDSDVPLIEDDRIRLTPKLSAAEVLVYEDIAVLAASFSLAHSKWNHKFGSDTAVLRVKETLDYEVKAADVHEVCCCVCMSRWADWRCTLPFDCRTAVACLLLTFSALHLTSICGVASNSIPGRLTGAPSSSFMTRRQCIICAWVSCKRRSRLRSSLASWHPARRFVAVCRSRSHVRSLIDPGPVVPLRCVIAVWHVWPLLACSLCGTCGLCLLACTWAVPQHCSSCHCRTVDSRGNGGG